MITRVKGTYDLFDTTLLNHLQKVIRAHLERSAFHEMATPILEPLDLFIRSLGTQTDVVSKEMYLAVGGASGTAHANSDQVALRPELTASIMRAVVQQGVTRLPLKLFTIGPCFRHERPQKGRLRQFTQTSIEVIGSSSIAQDALFLRMLDRLFDELLAGGYALVINFLGTTQDRAAHRAALVDFLAQKSADICATCQHRSHTNPLRIFDCKEASCQKIYETAPVILSYLSAESDLRWQALQGLLQELGVAYTIQPHLVRGLDYYTDTVFEFIALDGLGAQNTFCGGGRYDKLALEIGASTDLPSLGAAIGMERVMMLMEEQVQGDTVPERRKFVAVIPLSPAQQSLALHVTTYILQEGIPCDTLLESGSIKSLLKTAHASGARYVVLLGEDEQAAGTATLKDMVTGQQVVVPQRDVIDHIVW